MQKAKALLGVLGMIVGLCILGSSAIAQSSSNSNHDAAAQQEPAPQPNAADTATETKTFSGKIVKNENKLVLSDSEAKTTYQLDDQQKAQAFVNKNVKVTGVLDASTGVIRVSAIDLM